METIDLILAALVSGAEFTGKSNVDQATRAIYGTLKALILRKSSNLAIELQRLEEKLTSEATREVIREELASLDVANDQEIIQQARLLLENYARTTNSVVAIELENVQASSLKLSDIETSGVGIKARGLIITHDISIKNIKRIRK